MVASISVVGLGKVGSQLVACFAARGFRVRAVDADSRKVEQMGKALPPVHEPGLAELVREGAHNISATQDTQAAVGNSDATFIVVGTPSEPDEGVFSSLTPPRLGQQFPSRCCLDFDGLSSAYTPSATC